MKCPECGAEMEAEFDAFLTFYWCNKCGYRMLMRHGFEHKGDAV